jgi:hypothetical protein
MANSPLWPILWVLAAVIAGTLMFGAWTGPHRSVSNLSRWATRLHIRAVPEWLEARAADRWAFRGGLVTILVLIGIAALTLSQRGGDVPNADAGGNKPGVAPPQPGKSVVPNQRPDRHIDADLKKAILVHVPKTKQVKLVVLKDDPEADQFSWEIDAFLRAEGYTVVPRLFFAMAAGGKTPSGTTIYPDEKDTNVLVIRIGLNDRS